MKILLFGVTELGTSILNDLLSLPHFEVCGLVFNPSNNFDIQEMKAIAKRRQIDHYEVTNIRDSAFVSWVRDKRPDVIVIATFDFLVPKAISALARTTAVNIHPSYLPEYRGYHPYFWPIANGEKESGVTLHYLSDRFDEGQIVGQEKVAILPDDTAGTVLQKQKPVAWRLLKVFLDEVHRTGKAPQGKAQPAGDYITAPKIKVDDTIINWHWVTRKIVDRVRALNPHSPAYTFCRGEVLGLYQVAETKTKAGGAPGTICELGSAGPVVKTSDGAVVLRVVMLGRKYILTGQDFQEREKLQCGEVLS